MRNIKFQVFDSGVDIRIDQDWYSISNYLDLYKQKNSIKFKELARENLEVSKTAVVTFEDCCKNKSYMDNKLFILKWLYS